MRGFFLVLTFFYTRDTVASKKEVKSENSWECGFKLMLVVDIFAKHHNHISELELFIINLATKTLTKLCQKKYR